MAATPTQVGVINTALAMLGSTTRLQSINDNGNVAAHARAHWDMAVREMLADHPWNFAIRRTMLNEAGAAPEFDYDNAFTLPADCLRWLPPSPDDDSWFEAVCEGGKLLTNEAAPLPVRYISLELGEPVLNWSAHFAMAMAAKLALLLAEPITQSESTDSKMEGRFLAAIATAKRMDARESGHKRVRSVETRSRWAGAARSPARSFGR